MRPLTADEQRLVKEAMWIPRLLAPRIAREWPVERDEVLAVGDLILVEHVPSYDPTHHPRYDAYVYQRVWGGMLDYAHKKKLGLEAEVRALVGAELRSENAGSAPVRLSSSAAASRADTEEYLKLRVAEVAASSVLAEPRAAGGEDTVIEALDRERRRRAVQRVLLEKLSPAERTFVDEFYHQERTLDEIAAAAVVSKKTSQRAHAGIKATVKETIEDLGWDDGGAWTVKK